MKTRRYTPGWMTFIFVASLLGMGAWLGVGWWLEPRPLWIKSHSHNGRYFSPASYEPEQKLLAGFEYRYDQTNLKIITDTVILVLDANTGATVAQLNLGTVQHQGIIAHLMCCDPHIIQDRIFRFALRIENGQEIIELRSWAYRTDHQEKVEHTWSVDLQNLQPKWNLNDPSHFIIERQLPWLPGYICLPDATLGIGQALELSGRCCNHTKPMILESWTTQPITTALASWGQPLIGCSWTSANQPGKVFYQEAQEGRVYEVDTKTGKTQRFSISDTDHRIELLRADDHFAMFRHYERVEVKDELQAQYRSLQATPSALSHVNWSLDEWRPIYDLKNGRQLKWPKELDASILGSDYMAVDHNDSGRLLYYSSVIRNGPRPLEYFFQLISLKDDELKLTASWKNDDILNVLHLKFSNQLIATIDEIVIPLEFHKWIPSTPLIQDILLWFFPTERRSVVLLDEFTGKMVWKRRDRALLNAVGISNRMNRDFIMMEHFSSDQLRKEQLIDYECWALPIVIYSSWWSRGTGLVVLILAMMFFRRIARS